MCEVTIPKRYNGTRVVWLLARIHTPAQRVSASAVPQAHGGPNDAILDHEPKRLFKSADGHPHQQDWSRSGHDLKDVCSCEM